MAGCIRNSTEKKLGIVSERAIYSVYNFGSWFQNPGIGNLISRDHKFLLSLREIDNHRFL
jgi:hypothetical protein